MFRRVGPSRGNFQEGLSRSRLASRYIDDKERVEGAEGGDVGREGVGREGSCFARTRRTRSR